MNLRSIAIDPRRLRLLDINARFMRQTTYRQLVENVRRDGKLTSAPFVALWKVFKPGDLPQLDQDGRPIYEVLSGNHRTKAAIDAGLEEIVCLATDDPLPQEKRTAIQLSHNSLAGEDDPALLKQLYESLDVDLRQYAGLDDKTLGLLKEVKIDSLAEPNLEFQTLSIVCLPEEMERLRDVYARVRKLIKGDEVWLARWREYDRLMDTLDDVGSAHGIKNAATTLMLMLDIVERHLDELAEGWAGEKPKHNGYVPASSVFGSGKMPARTAQVLKNALSKLQSAGEATKGNLWPALELVVQRAGMG